MEGFQKDIKTEEGISILEAPIRAHGDLEETLEPEIVVEYIRSKGTNVERKENIKINFEKKLKEYMDFYKKNDMELPPGFEDKIIKIWNKNIGGIKEEIKEKGFNEVLLIPPTTNLSEINAKMTEGYKKEYYLNDFTTAGSFEKTKSKNTDKNRIVLVHKVKNLQDDPRLAKTLNTEGKDMDFDHTLTLDDYEVWQRKYLAETGEHLDSESMTRLASKVGDKIVHAHWDEKQKWLSINAFDSNQNIAKLGDRLATTFYE